MKTAQGKETTKGRWLRGDFSDKSRKKGMETMESLSHHALSCLEAMKPWVRGCYWHELSKTMAGKWMIFFQKPIMSLYIYVYIHTYIYKYIFNRIINAVNSIYWASTKQLCAEPARDRKPKFDAERICLGLRVLDLFSKEWIWAQKQYLLITE